MDDLCKNVETAFRLFDSERFHAGPHADAQAMFYAEAKRIKTRLEKNRRQGGSRASKLIIRHVCAFHRPR